MHSRSDELSQPSNVAGDAISTVVPVVSDDTATPAPTADQSTVTNALGKTFGPYEILGKLGEGGMGVVYKARHCHLDKIVAIKVLPPRFTQDAESVARFQREMRAVGKLSHPQIVQAFDAGELGGTHFLTMEYSEGTDLSRWVGSHGACSVAEACDYIRQSAQALDAAHTAGVVHRDVKPSNLLRTSAGAIKLLDLGLASLSDGGHAGDMTASGRAFGTPDFMAPEQWSDAHTADARADLYALGCTLYFLLTGRAPYDDQKHKSMVAKMTAHTQEPIPDLKAARADVPDSIVAIYQKLMAKSRDDRYSSAQELIAALDGLGAAETISYRPVDRRAVRQSGSISRRRMTLGLAVAVSVAAVAVGLSKPGGKTPPIQSSKTVANTVTSGPLRVLAIDVTHFKHTSAGDEPQGVLGTSTFNPALGDRVQVTARLSRPGYAYLVAFRPDGEAELCFPNREDEPPPLTDTPRYPLEDGLKAYGLREGAGLWAFAVLASDQPLPSWRERLEQRGKSVGVWKPAAQVPPGIVWWNDGVGAVDYLTAQGRIGAVRGKDESLEGPAAVITQLANSLRTPGDHETSAAIGLGVMPTK